ncbi:S-methyl-5-thioribose-1-phosphate isomerase [Elusimicrobiota bacterium]
MALIKTFYWKNNKFYILNQLLLPHKIEYICCSNCSEVEKAIKKMNVRGAPAIAVAAAFGVVLASIEKKFKSSKDIKNYLFKAIQKLSRTRPTAVNLFWVLERMKNVISKYSDINTIKNKLEREAGEIYDEDIRTNKKIGDNGEKLLNKNSVVLTHCNTGSLATAGYGTALGIIRSAHRVRKIKKVLVSETRPYLQGSRLTAWELKQEKIPYNLITDNMAGYLMRSTKIDAVIVGADRIAKNGDTANKIGTYSLSVLAKYHNIPFYVAAPESTIDPKILNGEQIKIENRSSDEVVYINGKAIAPVGTVALHPGFDVTPAENINAIITENGVYRPDEISRNFS